MEACTILVEQICISSHTLRQKHQAQALVAIFLGLIDVVYKRSRLFAKFASDEVVYLKASLLLSQRVIKDIIPKLNAYVVMVRQVVKVDSLFSHTTPNGIWTTIYHFALAHDTMILERPPKFFAEMCQTPGIVDFLLFQPH